MFVKVKSLNVLKVLISWQNGVLEDPQVLIYCIDQQSNYYKLCISIPRKNLKTDFPFQQQQKHKNNILKIIF